MRFAINLIHDGSPTEVDEWWRVADRNGVDVIAVADSPVLLPELWVTTTRCVSTTEQALIMTGVTNPVTRDPSVTASALFGLHQMAPGRVALGISTGDSAAWGVGLEPSSVGRLGSYIRAVKGLLAGDEIEYEGRRFRAHWPGHEPIPVPVYVACSGPRALRMAAQEADGLILSLGFSPGVINYVISTLTDGCAEVGRSIDDLDLWWNTEIVFDESIEAARERNLGIYTGWMVMGSLEGKGIPDEHVDALLELNRGMQDIEHDYQDAGLASALVRRAKELGIYEWLSTMAPGLFGTPDDVAARLIEHHRAGRDNWMFYVGHAGDDRLEQVRLISEEVLPRVRAAI